jgi:hypothetical protein
VHVYALEQLLGQLVLLERAVELERRGDGVYGLAGKVNTDKLT